VADPSCAESRTGQDSDVNTLIKSQGFNGIWVYGLSNSVQFHVPTDPPVIRTNKDSTGQTNDIYVVKLNVTNGDPWLSMMIGGVKNEGFVDGFNGDLAACDVYTLLWTESDSVDWGCADDLAVGSTRYRYDRQSSPRDTFILRWRGTAIFSTTAQNTRYIAVPGTNPVIYRFNDYTTQTLLYWAGGTPKLFYIEPVSQNYVYGFEINTASQYFSTQKTISNSDTSGHTSDVILARQLSNGAWSTGLQLQGTANEYVTQVIGAASKTSPYFNFGIGTFTSNQLSFVAQYTPASPAGVTSLTTTHTNNQVGKHDVWIVNFSPVSTATSVPIWSQAIGGTDDDFPDRIVLSLPNYASVYVYGRFKSTSITMNGQTYDKSAGSDATSEDIFVASLISSSGVYNFAAVFGGVKNEKVVNITQVSDGLIVVGHFDSKTMNVGSTVVTNSGDESTYDIFVIKYSTSGAVMWTKSIGGIANDYLQATVEPAGGGIVLYGLFGPSTFTISEYTLTNSKISGYSAFMVHIQSDGTYGWVKQLDGSFDLAAPPKLIRNTIGFSVTGQYSSDLGINSSGITTSFNNSGSGTDTFSAHLTTLCSINGVQCSGHGACNAATNICTCFQNYVVMGVQCVPRQCHGVDYNSASVCSSHGTCYTDGSCTCNANFYGDNCQHTTTCANIASSDPSVCSGMIINSVFCTVKY
jgi:hypothetical protein